MLVFERGGAQSKKVSKAAKMRAKLDGLIHLPWRRAGAASTLEGGLDGVTEFRN